MSVDREPIDLVSVVAEHHAAVYGYAYRLTGNVPDAEDLCQQAFLIAGQKIHQVRDPGSRRSWLFTVVRNCFLKSRQKQQPVTESALDLTVDALADTRFDELDYDPERLQQALDDLPEHYRIVLVMFFYEGCSYKEIAEGLDLPLGTVMSRLARGKQSLRDRLSLHAPRQVEGADELELAGRSNRPAPEEPE